MNVETATTRAVRTGESNLRKECETGRQSPGSDPGELGGNAHRISLHPASAIRTTAYNAGKAKGSTTVSLRARCSLLRCMKNRPTKAAFETAMVISASAIGFLGIPVEGVATMISRTVSTASATKTIQ